VEVPLDPFEPPPRVDGEGFEPGEPPLRVDGEVFEHVDLRGEDVDLALDPIEAPDQRDMSLGDHLDMVWMFSSNTSVRTRSSDIGYSILFMLAVSQARIGVQPTCMCASLVGTSLEMIAGAIDPTPDICQECGRTSDNRRLIHLINPTQGLFVRR
jgi:hypothetical protein